MKISTLLKQGRPLFSFEFFPPKDEAAAAALMDVIRHLKELRPDFVSVTYGAGGSTRTKTLDLVAKIKHDVGIETMAHLTCVGHSKDEVRAILKELQDRGVENIIALRGDPPRGETTFRPHPDGFKNANELVEEAARMGFCVAVAGYPEKHIEASTMEIDLANLKRKVDAGASFVTTQLFFQNDRYFEFVTMAKAVGVHLPIVAGIMPVTNVAQIQRFATMCGVQMPASLTAQLEPVKDDAEAVMRAGVAYASAQCRELLQRGAPGIHFYTLNKSRATREILETLQSFRNRGTPLLRDV
jgi:methylenetetrahydrofolate reductase (NADPH)